MTSGKGSVSLFLRLCPGRSTKLQQVAPHPGVQGQHRLNSVSCMKTMQNERSWSWETEGGWGVHTIWEQLKGGGEANMITIFFLKIIFTFFQHNIFIGSLEISYHVTWSHSFPSPSMPTPSNTPTTKQQPKNSSFHYLYTHWNVVKPSVA